MTKNSIMRKLFSITMCAILVLSLSACGSKEENVSNKDENTANSAASSEKDNQDIKKNVVKVDDLSVNPITIVGSDHSAKFGKLEGTVIEATIKNKSNDSVDVSLVVEATVEYIDDYEDKQTVNMLMYNPSKSFGNNATSFYSPYTRYNVHEANNSDIPVDGLIPVGLAPKEEKTVRYYFGENYFYGYDLDNDNEPMEIKDGTITKIKLKDVNCSVPDCEYVAVDEWEDCVELVKEKTHNNEYDSSMLAYLSGAIKNNTEERWKKATVQTDAEVDDQEYYEVIESTGSTIGIDHDFSLIFDRALRYPETSDCGFCSYIEYDSNDEQKIEVTPALMYYIPEGK